MPTNESKKSFLRRDMFGVGEHIPKIREIDVDKITPNPDQPRKFFDQAALDGLAASIVEKGLLQPILVKPTADGITFVIVAGERRFRAIQQIGWKTLPAIVPDGDMDEIALVENMQREGLQPLEEAEGVERLMKTHNYSLDEAGRVLGKSKSSVSELLSLLKLPEDMQSDVRTSEHAISKSTMIELAKMEPEAQRAAWEAIKAGGLGVSVRSAREARKGDLAGEGASLATPSIKDAVRGLYAFARRVSEHQGKISQEDLKVLKEAKKRADTAYKEIVGRA